MKETIHFKPIYSNTNSATLPLAIHFIHSIPLRRRSRFISFASLRYIPSIKFTGNSVIIVP